MTTIDQLTTAALQARIENLRNETSTKPAHKPSNKHFGVGPTMRPGSEEEQGEEAFRNWLKEKYSITLGELKQTMHRDPVSLAITNDTVKSIRKFFEVPATHRIGFVNGGGHQGMEAALLNFAHQDTPLLIEQGGVFKDTWRDDAVKLYASAGKKDNITILAANSGGVPQDLASRSNGIYCGTLNETTEGVTYNVEDWKQLTAWRAKDAQNLVMLDITSGLGSADIPWNQVDIAAFPPTKGINGAPAGIGFIVCSERAINRLNTTPAPAWPVLKGSALFEGLPNGQRKFKELVCDDPANPQRGITVINTIVIADFAEAVFRLEYMMKHSNLKQYVECATTNLQTLSTVLAKHQAQGTPHFKFRVEDASHRSHSVAVLDLVDPEIPQGKVDDVIENIYKILGRDKVTHNDTSTPGEDVAIDLRTFPTPGKPKGVRFWMGAVRPAGDIEPLIDNLEWAAKKAKLMLCEQELAKRPQEKPASPIVEAATVAVSFVEKITAEREQTTVAAVASHVRVNNAGGVGHAI